MSAAQVESPQGRSASPLTIEVGPAGDPCLLRVAGELDLGTAPALSKELNRLLSSGPQSVILDLEDLEFIDAAGIRCLLQAAVRSRADGNHLRVLPARGQVARVLALTGAASRLPLVS